jgi:uncharacterized protein YbjT (DUF2867 family)
MRDNEALDILRAQGHAATTPYRNGWVQVWIHGSNDAVDVKSGRELHELAEGKLSFDDIRERREDEVLIER